MKIETTENTQLAKAKGFATFNEGPHTLIDLSDLKEGNHTISVKLPNGNDVTFCIIPFFAASGGADGTIDIKYHNEDAKTKVIGFTNGRSDEINADMYTLDYKK